MKDPAADKTLCSSNKPLDAWSRPALDDWLDAPSFPTSTQPYKYTSGIEVDFERQWTLPSRDRLLTDEHVRFDPRVAPMGKKKQKKGAVDTPVVAQHVEPEEVSAALPTRGDAEEDELLGGGLFGDDEYVLRDVERSFASITTKPQLREQVLLTDSNSFAPRSRSPSLFSPPVPPPPPSQAPVLKPATSSRPPPPPPPPPVVNGASSPVLSALVDDSYDDPGFDTRAWARNVPFGVSPPNIGASPRDSPADRTPSVAGLGTSPSAPPFSLAGSPPSGLDRQRIVQNEDSRGGFAGPSPALSPRPSHRPIVRQSADTHSLSVSPRGRPVSMQYPSSTTVHRPQAHFRGLSEAEIGMMPSRSASGKREGGALVLFDQCYYEGHVGDVVIMATGNSIYISKLDREKMTILGTLTGLRGTVLSAKMLPPHGEKSFEPTIALIVHGPMLLSGEAEQGAFLREAPSTRARLSQNEAQTTVEVYAIKNSKHIATLYKSPSVNLGPRASLIDPSNAVGALAIHVGGSFVTVTSGHSGEVYIFRSLQNADEQSFICLGKTWTSMPAGRTRSYSVSSTSSLSTNSHDDVLGPQPPEQGMVSLSHRWLAVVPPAASSQTSLHGEVGVPAKTAREPPGLLSHTSPAQPSANCEADTPLDEGFINKMARDAAQEAMKGARRAGEAGFQALKNYWNKTEPQQPSFDPNAYHASYGQQASSFPPTHAQDNLNRPTASSTLVSIIDLERLYESNDNRAGMLVQPIATFPVRYGCSYLSFNPTGLSLFTSSAKGDVSYVWCLMRMIHGTVATPAGDVSAADNHASVRQIARFSRFTTSNIVDVIWTKPRGEKLAILTERATVHIHDLPASAFRWPPPARHNTPASTPGAANETASQRSQGSGRFGSAISYVQDTAQSFSAAKIRSSLTGATFSGLAATAGVKGGRMVAAGISRSMGAASGTMSNIRHMGENRISLPGGRKARVVVGTVALLSGKYQDAIAITGDGVIKLHAIRLSVTDGGKGKRSVAGEQINQMTAPKIDDLGNTGAGLDGLSVKGQWFADTSAHTFKPGQPQPQPLSFAEIETSTPYRTFHNDHRVSMNTYADGAKIGDDISEDWVFGEDIETEPVGADQLPIGSMHLGTVHDDKDAVDAENTFAFDDDGDEDAPPTSSRGGGAKASSVPVPKYDDLIDIGDEDIDAFEAGAVRDAQRAELDEDEDGGEAMPFGANSEFGY